MFVTKFDPTGNSLVFSTLLRGTDGYNDSGYGIGLDSHENVYVDGVTGDSDFPLLNPFQSSIGDVFSAGVYYSSIQSGFVAGLDSTGALIYSTYFGGRNDSDTTNLNGIAVDASGDAYVVGDTTSQNFPVANSYQATSNVSYPGETTAVVAEFNPQGQPIYSTYLGGSSSDSGTAIAVDSSGNAYVTGTAGSTDFPVQTSPAPFQSTNNGGDDVFVSKLTFASTVHLAYSTYLGGSNSDTAYGIAVDGANPPNVYLTGNTVSTSTTSGFKQFPTQSPIFGPNTCSGTCSEAFVTKLKGDFTVLVYSTFLGGTGNPSTSAGDIGYSIVLDQANPPDAFVTGSTASPDFPTQAPLQSTLSPAATSNVFVTEVNGAGSQLLYSTYLGGSGTDVGQGIAVDSTGNAYVTGNTTSSNFPVLSSSGVAVKPFQERLLSSAGNAFLTKVSPTAASGLNFFPPVFDFHDTGVG
ncbi:MAG: SBBP repeat-containing protein, partial [Candidatus Acidiferrales bacterium]